MMKSEGRGLWCIGDNNTCLHQPAICCQTSVLPRTLAITPSVLSECSSCCKPQWHMASAVCFCLYPCPFTLLLLSGQCRHVSAALLLPFDYKPVNFKHQLLHCSSIPSGICSERLTTFYVLLNPTVESRL